MKARTFHFIGKDNIPFHAIIWPAELLGAGEAFDKEFGCEKKEPFVLPYDVPANEFLNLEGQKISGSRNWAVWGLDFLTRYDPDALRYYLSNIMPETRDTDWDWNEFYHRNNDELVATWGNLANRVLSFAYKHWEGIVPDPGQLNKEDLALLVEVEKGFETVGKELDAVHLRAALNEAMRLAGEVNKYLDQTAPWLAIKTDKEQAGHAIFVAMKAIDSLKILFAPYLPFSSEKLHQYLGYEGQLFGEQYTKEIKDALGSHTALMYDPSKATGSLAAKQFSSRQQVQSTAALVQETGPKHCGRGTQPPGRKIKSLIACVIPSECNERGDLGLYENVDCLTKWRTFLSAILFLPMHSHFKYQSSIIHISSTF